MATDGMLSGRGRFKARALLLSRCTDLRKAKVLTGIPSSLLSDGRLPFDDALVDILFTGSFGSADGHNVVRDTSWLRLDLPDPFDSCPGRPN
jgi:hypothetical protein